MTENSPGSFSCQEQNLQSGKGKGPLEPSEQSVPGHERALLTRLPYVLTAVDCYHSMVGWVHGGSDIYGVLSQSGLVYCDIGCHTANT